MEFRDIEFEVRVQHFDIRVQYFEVCVCAVWYHCSDSSGVAYYVRSGD